MRTVARFAALASFLCLVLALPPAAARDLGTRPVGPVHTWTGGDLARFDPAWLHVKFVEGSDGELVDGRCVAADRSHLAAVNAAIADAVTVRRTFPGERETFREWKRRGEAASGRTGPDLALWYDVELPADRAGLATALAALNALPEVEIAHPAPVCEPAVIATGAAGAAAGAPDLRTPDFAGLQGYLYDPPVGLDAPAAWAFTGGRGAGRKFLDVELGWTLGHEDFSQRHFFYHGGGNDAAYVPHGTAVLGEVIGMPNGYGVTGFASDAAWGVVAITVEEWPNVPHYFLEAINALDPGDVWLIELQMYPPGRDATPMEWLQVNFDAIWTGCWSLGVVCIEAGANGGQNLDSSVWNGVFDRTVRDSGAIMVAAGTPTGRVAEWFTNYGSRMDVHAWGSEIVTTGYGDLHDGGSEETLYTDEFGGTSGASPMVAGASLCLQGIAVEYRGSPLTPLELRTLLHDTGIPHLGSLAIGPRPDLAAAAAQIVDTTEAPLAAAPASLAVLSVVSPFSGGTVVQFAQGRTGTARLHVFDVAGRRVRTIEGPAAAAGVRSLAWDGRLGDGREAGSGVYLYRLEAGGEVTTGRLVKVR